VNYAYNSEHRKRYRIRTLCGGLGVLSEQSYYSFLRKGESEWDKSDRSLGDVIEVIFHENKRRYGIKRIQDEVKAPQ
jgi:hypothetical protein